MKLQQEVYCNCIHTELLSLHHRIPTHKGEPLDFLPALVFALMELGHTVLFGFAKEACRQATADFLTIARSCVWKFLVSTAHSKAVLIRMESHSILQECIRTAMCQRLSSFGSRWAKLCMGLVSPPGHQGEQLSLPQNSLGDPFHICRRPMYLWRTICFTSQ